MVVGGSWGVVEATIIVVWAAGVAVTYCPGLPCWSKPMMQCFPLEIYMHMVELGGMQIVGKKVNLAPGWDADVTAVSARQRGLFAAGPEPSESLWLLFDTLTMQKPPPLPLHFSAKPLQTQNSRAE